MPLKDADNIQSEEQTVYTPEILIFDNQESADEFAAQFVISTLQKKPHSHLLMPTGRRVKHMYHQLVEAYSKGQVSFKNATIFNLDEYWPLPRKHPQSYYSFMLNNLINYVDLEPENWHIPNSEAPSPEDEAVHYKEKLASIGIDVAVLGIGPGATCHIGFNEKGSQIDSQVRYVQIDGETAATNIRLFDNPNEFPYGAITVGVSDILSAQSILLLARGKDKAWGVARSLQGVIGPDAPASFLRTHPKVKFILDKAAASLL